MSHMSASREGSPRPAVDPFFRVVHGLENLNSTMHIPLHGSSSCLPAFESPSKALAALAELVEQLSDELLQRLHQTSANAAKGGIHGNEEAEAASSSTLLPANDETPLLQYNRWLTLLKAFRTPHAAYDTTKIPDIYDNSVYDMIHNQQLGLRALPELYTVARSLARYVVPQEYGIGREEKVTIGTQIGGAMLEKLRTDLLAGMNDDNSRDRVHQLDSSAPTDVRTPQRHVRTRFYFTSESHMHSLFNVLLHGCSQRTSMDGSPWSIFSPEAQAKIAEAEWTYLTHIIFRVYLQSAPSQSPSSPNARDASVPSPSPSGSSQYTVEVLFSPGVNFANTIGAAARSEDLATPPVETAAADAFVASSEGLSLQIVEGFIGELLGGEHCLLSDSGRMSESSWGGG